MISSSNSNINKDNKKDLWSDEEVFQYVKKTENEKYQTIEEYQDQVEFQKRDNYKLQNFNKNQYLYQSSSIYN